MMKLLIKRLLFPVLALVPLATMLPYMYHSWRTSPLDRWNWIGLTLFAVFLGLMIPRIEKRRRHFVPGVIASSILLAVSTAGYILCTCRDMNFGIYFSSVVFFVALGWLSCGWKNAAAFLPCAGLLIISATSIVFLAPGFQNPLTRTVCIAGLSAWAAVNCFSDRLIPGLHDGMFLIAVAAVFIISSRVFDISTTGAPCIPRLRDPIGHYCGRVQKPTIVDRHFFKRSRFIRRVYRERDSGDPVGILMVEPNGAIHEIHPADHCLRSAGVHVLSVQRAEVDTGGAPLYVTEIVSRSRSGIRLTWAWYSTPDFSVANFISFRVRWNNRDRWVAIQATTPLSDGNLAAARSRLGRFLKIAEHD